MESYKSNIISPSESMEVSEMCYSNYQNIFATSSVTVTCAQLYLFLCVCEVLKIFLSGGFLWCEQSCVFHSDNSRYTDFFGILASSCFLQLPGCC